MNDLLFKIKTSLLLTVFIFVGIFSNAQSADPAITGANFIEDETLLGSTSTLEVSFVNSGFTPIPASSIELTISTPIQYSSDGISAPTGEGADLFTWVYIQDDVWRGTNNSPIEAFEGGLINISVTGLNVTSTFEATNVNVQPVDNFSDFNDSSGNNNLQPGLKISNSGVLPVVWNSFNVTDIGESHFIEWKTSEEVNVDKYIVERRFGADSFSSLHSVKQQNVSSNAEKVYSFDDFDVNQSGLYFYRIKQVDLNGTFEYSSVKSIYRDAVAANFTLFPNPTTDRINIKGSIDDQTTYTCHIVDSEGHAVLLKKVLAVNGILELNLTDLHSGIYYVLIMDNTKVEAKIKFVKI